MRKLLLTIAAGILLLFLQSSMSTNNIDRRFFYCDFEILDVDSNLFKYSAPGSLSIAFRPKGRSADFCINTEKKINTSSVAQYTCSLNIEDFNPLALLAKPIVQKSKTNKTHEVVLDVDIYLKYRYEPSDPNIPILDTIIGPIKTFRDHSFFVEQKGDEFLPARDTITITNQWLDELNKITEL